MKKVTVLGGGTGSFVVLSGIKKDPNIDIAAIVTMTDSGGSTGRLRDQLGVLPPGDLRQCLVALSEAPELWRKLFLYRFENGDLEGHNFGNIFLSALEKVSDNYDMVIDTAGYVLNIRGKVLPVTFEKTHLCVEYESGKVIKQEGNIDENNGESSKIRRAYLEPDANVNKKVIDRIYQSDYIIIGPGDLYTSIVPILLVDDIKTHITKSKAKIIYILNLMTKLGQTTGYAAEDFIDDLKKYLGRAPDYVIANTGKIDDKIIRWYADHKETPVENKFDKFAFKGKIVQEDIINRSSVKKNPADKITRSILRHDTEKLARLLFGIINK